MSSRLSHPISDKQNANDSSNLSDVDWYSKAHLSSITSATTPAHIHITVDWQPDGPLMSKAPQEGFSVDILPLTSAVNSSERSLLLPGSSLKGALRAQAERILNTLFYTPTDDAQTQPKSHALVNTLFGGSNGEQKQKGLLAINSCYSQDRLDKEKFRALTRSTSILNKEQNEALGLNAFETAFHVAIDRWTGGAAEGMLFSCIEPRGVQWQPIELTLTLPKTEKKQSKDDDRTSELLMSFLFLILRDLWQGRIYLGYGVNRGYGALKVFNIEFKGLNNLDANWPESFSINTDDSIARERPNPPKKEQGQEVFLNELEKAWEMYVKSSNEMQSKASV